MAKSKTVYLTIDENGAGMVQLSISQKDGAGYRICGPKYDGTGRTIKRHELTASDVVEITRYLKMVQRIPQETTES